MSLGQGRVACGREPRRFATRAIHQVPKLAIKLKSELTAGKNGDKNTAVIPNTVTGATIGSAKMFASTPKRGNSGCNISITGMQ